jgi:hypothetical protein
MKYRQQVFWHNSIQNIAIFEKKLLSELNKNTVKQYLIQSKRKKSEWAKPGEYDGYWTILMEFDSQNPQDFRAI